MLDFWRRAERQVNHLYQEYNYALEEAREAFIAYDEARKARIEYDDQQTGEASGKGL